MKKRLFLRNTVTVMLSSLLFQVIGISFRVYMSSKIGAEALGVYQLIVMIYAFVLVLSTSGISLATTRLITDYLAESKQLYIKRTMLISFSCVLVLSFTLGTALYFSSDFIGLSILNDIRTVTPLKILSISLPFVAISSACRGYFYALRQVIKTTGEQFIEQTVEIAVFAIMLSLNPSFDISYACYAIVMGTLSAEITSALYSYILYRIDIRRFIKSSTIKPEKGTNIFKNLVKISVPVSANACLRSGLSTVENILIPRGFKQYGASYETALCDYGMITGMVMPIISFPGSILVSLSMLLIPEISEANVKHKKNAIKYITSKVFGITFFFSIMVSGILFFFGKELSLLLYSSEDAGAYISLIAPLIPLTYLDSMVDAILKGLNDQLMYLTYNLIDSVMRIILILILLPFLGVKGLIIVIFASEILNSSLSILRLMKLTSLKIKLLKWIIKPYIAIAVAGLTVGYLNFDSIGSTANCIIKLICTVILYVLLLLLSKSFSKDDIDYLKNNLSQLKKSFQKPTFLPKI